MTTTERFWDKVDIGSKDECWEWNGYYTKGYGMFWLEGKHVYTHRYSFFLHYNFYPPVVMHICDNPPCCNPSHLTAGTQALNVADRDTKGRHGSSKKTHCPSGHEYDESNTYITPKGYRDCRECRRVANGRYIRKIKRKESTR